MGRAGGVGEPPRGPRPSAPRASLGPSVARWESRGSVAQPIRRVFVTVVFHAREHVELPPPGDGRPARLTVELHDLVWDALYAPIAGGIGFAADRLNHLQFLTIRQFLRLVFAALVLLL